MYYIPLQKKHKGMKKQTIILSWLLSFTVSTQAQVNESITDNDSLQTIQIGEIEVTANRNMQRLRKGGLITEVENSDLSQLGTCRDVISQLPGVRTDEGNIEIIGCGTPQIYVNGQRLTDDSELDRMSSKEIKSVEIVFNPGAKYGAETRAVIIIRTIRRQGDGLSGSVQASGRQGHFLSQSDNLFLNYRKEGVDIFGAFNYDHSRRYQKQRNVTVINTEKDDYLVSSDIRIYPKANSYLANIGANWQIDSNNSIGVKYEYSATPDSRSHWSTYETVSVNHMDNNEISRDTYWRGHSMPTNLLNQYYQGKIKNFNITVNNDYYYRMSINNQSIYEKDVSGEKRQIGSISRIKSSMFASKGVVEYSFGKNSLEFGYEFTFSERNENFKNDGSDQPDADDRIKEMTGAGFAAVNIPIRNTELYAGIRYEHTSSDYYQNGSFVEGQSRKYSRLYPNIDFTFPVKNAKFTLSYEAKTKRPLYSQLSSSIQYDDRFTYETGNPILKSEHIHTVSLAGIYKWVFFSASYTYNANAIISVIRRYLPDEPVNIMTYDNFKHLSKSNIVLSISPRISQWSPRLRFNLMGQRFSMKTHKGMQELNTPILFVNLFNSISLGKGFILNGDVSGRCQGDMDVVTIKL